MNSAFLTYLAENTLYQSVESPTRFRDGQIPSLLDLVITDDPDQILSIDHLPPIGASDHVCLLTTLQTVTTLFRPYLQKIYRLRENPQGTKENAKWRLGSTV